jgi:hypothetical protein
MEHAVVLDDGEAGAASSAASASAAQHATVAPVTQSAISRPACGSWGTPRRMALRARRTRRQADATDFPVPIESAIMLRTPSLGRTTGMGWKA